MHSWFGQRESVTQTGVDEPVTVAHARRMMKWLRLLARRLGGAPHTSGLDPGSSTEDPDVPDVVEMPIDGELDLHTFQPRETRDVVLAYIEEAHARGLREIRIVHGKGKGVQRRIVHSVLDGHPLVRSYRTAGEGRGGWGATLVDLVR